MSASTDSDEDEATENTRLMSETVAMENRAYNTEHSDSYAVGSRQANSSGPAVILPSSEEVGGLIFTSSLHLSQRLWKYFFRLSGVRVV